MARRKMQSPVARTINPVIPYSEGIEDQPKIPVGIPEIPGSQMPPASTGIGTQAAMQGLGPAMSIGRAGIQTEQFVQQKAELEDQKRKAAEFQELLGQGLPGLQSFVEEVKQTKPDIGMLFQKEVDDLKTVLPQLEPQDATNTIVSTYSSFWNRMQAAEKPNYLEDLARLRGEITLKAIEQRAANAKDLETLKQENRKRLLAYGIKIGAKKGTKPEDYTFTAENASAALNEVEDDLAKIDSTIGTNKYPPDALIKARDVLVSQQKFYTAWLYKATQGGAEVPVEPASPPDSTIGAKGPPIGTIRKGYRFKGGNPKDKKNWEKQ